jgi:signal transduction histidine kinase
LNQDSDDGRAPRVMREISRVSPVVADTALAVVLAVPLVVDLARSDTPPAPFRAPDLVGCVLVAVLVLPLAVRRRHPMGVFFTILAAAVITASVAYHPTSFGFGLIVATYTVARWCGRPRSLVALALALLFSVFVKVRFIAAGIDIALFEWPLDAAYMVGSWFLGDSLRTRAAQTAELERNREALAQQAVEREHLRIARELHDSVGHSLSVMVLYSGAAERNLNQDPDRARNLIGTVIDSGREALEEMDQMVRILRNEAPRSSGLDAVDALADEFRGLGLAVEVHTAGEPRSVPDAVDQAAFRLIQEALTNTLKHASASSAEVWINYGPDSLTVGVFDDGIGCSNAEALASGRHGLVGMRERVLALGGRLTAGPRPGGAGFLVEATLPRASGART